MEMSDLYHVEIKERLSGREESLSVFRVGLLTQSLLIINAKQAILQLVYEVFSLIQNKNEIQDIQPSQ